MFFIFAMAIIVLLYLFGFKVIYFTAGGLVAFYAVAVVSARRSISSSEKRSSAFDSESGR